jgi:hypothetical protein
MSALPQVEINRLEKQRSFVLDHYDPGSGRFYDTLEGKINLLEAILDAKWIEPGETWKFQSPGVTFGDALAQKLALIADHVGGTALAFRTSCHESE